MSTPTPSEKMFKEAVENMKTATRRYAKRQVQWIRNKLLPETVTANTISRAESGIDTTPTYLLDATGKFFKCFRDVQSGIHRTQSLEMHGKLEFRTSQPVLLIVRSHIIVSA